MCPFFRCYLLNSLISIWMVHRDTFFSFAHFFFCADKRLMLAFILQPLAKRSKVEKKKFMEIDWKSPTNYILTHSMGCEKNMCRSKVINYFGIHVAEISRFGPIHEYVKRIKEVSLRSEILVRSDLLLGKWFPGDLHNSHCTVTIVAIFHTWNSAARCDSFCMSFGPHKMYDRTSDWVEQFKLRLMLYLFSRHRFFWHWKNTDT